MLTSSSACFLLFVHEKMDSKERVISEVYYNVRTGFGSIAETLKQAKRKDPRITRNVTNFSNQQDINQKRNRNRYNSFVPLFPREQYQIDLADFGGGDDFRYDFRVHRCVHQNVSGCPPEK